MNRMTPSLLVLAGALVVACGPDKTPKRGEKERARDAILALFDVPCDDPLDSVYESLPAPANWDAGMRGQVTRCAYDRLVTAEEMSSTLQDAGYPDSGLSTGAHKLRIAYWTERNEGEARLTSGALYVPEERRAEASPLLVMGHGSVGVADHCAPSKEDPGGFETGWKGLVYTFAGDGWVTLQPDYPGLGTDGTTTWMYAPDEGHALLDATRAARNLTKPGVLSDRNALLGHSNGGHAALSAQAYAADYGSDGSVDTVVLYSPFWLSNGAWGALTTDVGNVLMDPVFMGMTMMYWYGHYEAYEGVDAALDAFLPHKQQAAKELMESGCWVQVTDEVVGPPSIGVHVGSDLFSEEFIYELGSCGLSDFCPTPWAETWRERWAIDRPATDPTIPVVQWMGALDTFNPPEFQQCGITRVEAQGTPLQVCVDEQGDHSTMMASSASWVREYLAFVLLDAPEPPACPGLEVLGGAPDCELLIPNSPDPSDP